MKEYILANRDKTPKEIAEIFNCSVSAVTKAKRLAGIRTRIFYNKEQKIKIINQIIEGENKEEVCENYGISIVTFWRWTRDSTYVPKVEDVPLPKRWSKQTKGFFNVNEFENWII